jgi:hypothetical protein
LAAPSQEITSEDCTGDAIDKVWKKLEREFRESCGSLEREESDRRLSVIRRGKESSVIVLS